MSIILNFKIIILVKVKYYICQSLRIALVEVKNNTSWIQVYLLGSTILVKILVDINNTCWN